MKTFSQGVNSIAALCLPSKWEVMGLIFDTKNKQTNKETPQNPNNNYNNTSQKWDVGGGFQIVKCVFFQKIYSKSIQNPGMENARKNKKFLKSFSS